MAHPERAYQEQVVEVDTENGGRVSDQREGLGATVGCDARKTDRRGNISFYVPKAGLPHLKLCSSHGHQRDVLYGFLEGIEASGNVGEEHFLFDCRKVNAEAR